MVDTLDSDGHRIKRFKYQSYAERLKGVHLPSTFATDLDANDEEEGSQFKASIEQWTQLNLSPAFVKFSTKAASLSESLPLLVHNWKDIVALWIVAVDENEDEALRPLFDILQNLCFDLRLTIDPSYDEILDRLLRYVGRPLSPDVITTLLSSLSTFFKFILVPRLSSDSSSALLDYTWSKIYRVLPTCNPEIRRALAEVWSTVVRRVKKVLYGHCVDLLFQADDISDVAAWTLVYAMKSVSQSLHSCTEPLFDAVMERHLSFRTRNVEHTEKIIRRTLTALIHHSSKPHQFSVIVELLYKRLVECGENDTKDDAQHTENIRRILEVISIPCSVRKGARLTSKQLSDILQQVELLPDVNEIWSSRSKVTVSVLLSANSDLVLWMGVGRRVIDGLWSMRPTIALSVCGVLLDLDWPGFKQFALPQVLKNARASSDMEEEWNFKVLRMFTTLARKSLLRAQDITWQENVHTWLRSWLSSFSATESSAQVLSDIGPLVPLLPQQELISAMMSVTESLVMSSISSAEDPASENLALALSSCLRFLGRTALSSTSQVQARITPIYTDVVQKWSWSGEVMVAFAELVRKCMPSHDANPSYEELRASLMANISSHSRTLRLSSLELLKCTTLLSPSLRDVLDACFTAEEVPLEVRGVRERILHIKRIPKTIPDDDVEAADIASEWLIGQLKVGLRPTWGAAAEALTQLSERYPSVTWTSIFNHLKSCQVLDSENDNDHEAPEEVHNQVPSTKPADTETREEERSWRDPNAHKLRTTINGWLQYDFTVKPEVKERYDCRSFEEQLLSTLGQCPSLAEKNNRDLVPLFLALASPSLSNKPRRSRLMEWLKLFSKFSNGKALLDAQLVQSVFISYLSHPDKLLQKQALSCLLTFKSAALMRQEAQLQVLLDETKWRDELTLLDLQQLEADERPEVIPVFIRLMYGMMLDRRAQAKKRAAILGALGACTGTELKLLVELMLEPFGDLPDLDDEMIDLDESSQKQQAGFLTLLGPVLRNLGSRIVAHWPALMSATMIFVADAQRKLQTLPQDSSADPNVVDSEIVEEETSDNSAHPTKRLRVIRQLGIKRLTEFFRSSPTFDFDKYVEYAFKNCISPRLPLLDQENTQSPSALLELLGTLAGSSSTVTYLVRFDDKTLPKIYNCLVAKNVKPAIVSHVLDMIEHILSHSDADKRILESVVMPNMPELLHDLATLAQRTPMNAPTPVLQKQLRILSSIAPYITDSNQASMLLGLFIPLIQQQHRIVPERLKIEMLKVIQRLIPLAPAIVDGSSQLYTRTNNCFAFAFRTLRSRQARSALVDAYHSLATVHPRLSVIADLLSSLNAYSERRLDEPDFERRLAAFTLITDEFCRSLELEVWVALLSNMLHFIQDENELSIRTNASLVMRCFIDSVAAEEGNVLQHTFSRMLLPGLKRCLRSRNELIIRESLGVISYAVEKCPGLSSLQGMAPLLAGGDEEANFFNNIFHVQVHRRTRALRRLSDRCDTGELRSSILAEIFLPLVDHFIAASQSIDHQLLNEAIVTVGHISHQLAWGGYHTLVQRYIKLSTAKTAAERVYVRALVSALDNFHFPMEEVTEDTEPALEDGDDVEPEIIIPVIGTSRTKIADIVNDRLLPNLLKHLEERDGLQENNRIPLAIGIVKVAQHLPISTKETQISRLFTILSQILRSRSQETRDRTRETLCKIATNLGTAYLPSMLKELRLALVRGTQLHILAYTSHAVLASVAANEQQSIGSFDECVPSAVHIASEVVFGEPSKDAQAEEFKTKVKEVHSSPSKGADTFAILAKCITPSAMANLLLPLKSIMQETETMKAMQQVDETLRRIASGIISNPRFGPTDILLLSHTLISQNARFLQEVPKIKHARSKRKQNDSAIVQTTRNAFSTSNHYVHNSFRFVCLGLDLFNTAFRRSRFDFEDPKIIARLDPMVAVIGNALYSNNGQVVTLGLKAATSILKCPLKAMEKSLPIFIRQSFDIIRRAGSSESELAQAALKFLGVILRDISSAKVKEDDLSFLLEVVTPDLEEPNRQAPAFNLLRAIVTRKFVVPEIYDLMDRVAEIMVTNQSVQVQEQCRGILLQFLLDYPQGKGRVKRQMTFLAKNLSYVFESGRKSVMELLNAVVNKFHDDLIQEYADLLFVALVMVLANDESAKCREMAAQLIKSLFVRLEEDKRKVMLDYIHAWATRTDNPALSRVSSQLYGLIADVLQENGHQYVDVILQDANGKLRVSAEQFDSLNLDAEEDAIEVDLDWQTPYQALNVMTKLFAQYPDHADLQEGVDWTACSKLLLYPHAWVRTAACRLLGSYFSIVPVSAPSREAPDESPVSWVGMRNIAKALCMQLKSEHLDNVLGVQVTKNLFYVGKCYSAVPQEATEASGVVDTEKEEEYKLQDEDDDEEIHGGDKTEGSSGNPLPWLFSRLSYQARSAHIARRNKRIKPGNWAQQPLAILRWFAAMASYIEPAVLEKFLPHILSPVYRIVEDDTIHDTQMDELKSLAVELQDLVQKRVGSNQFANAYARVRQSIMHVRRERKTMRILQTATNPQLLARRKMQKSMVKKESRKRKNQVFAERKGKRLSSKRS